MVVKEELEPNVHGRVRYHVVEQLVHLLQLASLQLQTKPGQQGLTVCTPSLSVSSLSLMVHSQPLSLK